MKLTSFIALRYLFARKTHNVINIISAISAIGMAIGTAALVIVLSVYNGFDAMIEDSLNEKSPDILITPAKGKVFIPEGDLFTSIESNPLVVSTEKKLSDQVFINYDGRQGIGRAVGEEDISLWHGDLPLCAVSSSLAAKLGINPAFVASLEVFYPKREGNISLAAPQEALGSIRLHPVRVVDASADDDFIIVPKSCLAELLEYDEEISSYGLWLESGLKERDVRNLCREIRENGAGDFIVSDRIQQNSSLYKMMRYEKFAIFLILMFIIIIISFNVFGSLSMLIIDKKEDIWTLRCLGMRDRGIRRIFILEGWMISLLGLACGLVIGLGLALAQQKFGLIKVPGNFLFEAYPVLIKGSDIAATSFGVALIGYLIAILPARSVVQNQRALQSDRQE